MLLALLSTIVETIKEKKQNCREQEERRLYEDIDFDEIESVTLEGTKTAYRTETEEEFDIVATHFLTQKDGWQHYETKTVEYEVEDGKNYCFTIRYNDGTEIYRVFHESSPITERLLKCCQDDIDKAYADVEAAIEDVVNEIGNMFQL